MGLWFDQKRIARLVKLATLQVLCKAGFVIGNASLRSLTIRLRFAK